VEAGVEARVGAGVGAGVGAWVEVGVEAGVRGVVRPSGSTKGFSPMSLMKLLMNSGTQHCCRM